jgi:hypothetical protein
MRRLAIPALLVAGCTQVVQVDRFTFDDEPCGPRPRTCVPAGPEQTWVAVDGGFGRSDASGRRIGVDLDGTSDAICGQSDFVDPSGTTGIDDQLAFFVENGERLGGLDHWAEYRELVAGGGEASLLFLEGVDGPNDDCVYVTFRRGLPSADVVQTLDADGDGELDPGIVFDYTTPDLGAERACVIDGTLHARFPDAEISTPFGPAFVRDVRFRATLGADRLEHATFAGAVPVSELARLLPTEVAEIARLSADLEPSARDAFDCQSISATVTRAHVSAIRGRPL